VALSTLPRSIVRHVECFVTCSWQASCMVCWPVLWCRTYRCSGQCFTDGVLHKWNWWTDSLVWLQWLHAWTVGHSYQWQGVLRLWLQGTLPTDMFTWVTDSQWCIGKSIVTSYNILLPQCTKCWDSYFVHSHIVKFWSKYTYSSRSILIFITSVEQFNFGWWHSCVMFNVGHSSVV